MPTGQAWGFYDILKTRLLTALNGRFCIQVGHVTGSWLLVAVRIGLWKALRVVAVQGGDVINYLKHPEKIGVNVAPYITIPTTAGMGAEITLGVAFIEKNARHGHPQNPRET